MPYFFGDQDIVLPDVGAAVEDRYHDGVGTLEHFAAIGGCRDLGRVVSLVDDFLTGAAGEVEALLAYIDEGDLAVF